MSGLGHGMSTWVTNVQEPVGWRGFLSFCAGIGGPRDPRRSEGGRVRHSDRLIRPRLRTSRRLHSPKPDTLRRHALAADVG
jgi:hypothetical protein